MANEKRLTEKHYNGNGYYLLCSGVLRCDNKCDDCDELVKAIDRLGEFEDKAEQTVDAVEVVRCRECMYRKTERCQMYWESEDGREQYNWETDDDFCSSGKRRDEE